jgi:sugar/nucleoside kinase (ribokinase family)
LTTSRTPTLIALGDLMLDVVVRAASAIERGSDVPGGIRFRQGGSAANAARAFARLGGRGVLVCSVGRDGWGRRLVSALRADGVEVHPVAVRGATGRLVAIVDGRGERSFVTDRGAADALRPIDLRESWWRGAGVLHIPAYSLFHEPLGGAAVRGADLARTAGALVSVDLASAAPLREFGPAATRAAIARLAPDVVFANRDEAAALGGNRQRSLSVLQGLAPLAVLKDGADGCRVAWLATGSGEQHRLDVATTPIPAVDTTGAGDAFAAGFLHMLLRSRDPARAVADGAALRRAALAGHRSASALLSRPRIDLGL